MRDRARMGPDAGRRPPGAGCAATRRPWRALGLLGLLYLLALFAPFVAPYPPDELDRARFYHPPQALHWRDAAGRFHLRRSCTRRRRAPGSSSTARTATRPLPLRFLVRGAPYRLLGLLPTDRHLFGVDAPGARLPARHRPVRARRALAAAVRGARLADGRAGRHRHLVRARAAARRRRRLLRRLGGRAAHALERGPALHPRALPDHRAAHRLPAPSCRAGRSTSSSSPSWRSSAGRAWRASSAAWCWPSAGPTT